MKFDQSHQDRRYDGYEVKDTVTIRLRIWVVKYIREQRKYGTVRTGSRTLCTAMKPDSQYDDFVSHLMGSLYSVICA